MSNAIVDCVSRHAAAVLGTGQTSTPAAVLQSDIKLTRRCREVLLATIFRRATPLNREWCQ